MTLNGTHHHDTLRIYRDHRHKETITTSHHEGREVRGEKIGKELVDNGSDAKRNNDSEICSIEE